MDEADQAPTQTWADSAVATPRLARCDGAHDEARRRAAADGHKCPQAKAQVELALAQTTVLTRKLVCPACPFVSSKGQAEVAVAADGSASVSVCPSNQVRTRSFLSHCTTACALVWEGGTTALAAFPCRTATTSSAHCPPG